MCGINGFNFMDKQIIKKMNDSIKHRGPDCEGIFIGGDISFGHRRLSIIDLSPKGNQPMFYLHKGRKLIIVFNGEIYNYQKLKIELIERGYKFNSKTDTEVVLASYIEWGEDCVNKFNGMWAFCIFDPKNEVFFLSRDRLGKKPLYYFFNGKKFIFSSEIKAILLHKIKFSINPEAMDLYLSLGFIPSPYAIYNNVFKVEPGHNIFFNLRNYNLIKKKYYEYPKYNPTFNKKELIREGQDLLRDATKARLISDVPLGAFLSGGVDSSTIVAQMTKLIKKENTITFSINIKGLNDSKYVKIFKKFFKIENYNKNFDEKEFRKITNKIFYFYDEPFSDYSMFPSFFLCNFASKKIKVSLSGDGGDEIFGGYDHYKSVAKIIFLKRIPKSLRIFALHLIPNKNKTFIFREGIKLSLKKPEEIFSESWEGVYKPEIYKKIVKDKMTQMLNLTKGDLLEATIYFDKYFKTMGDNFLCKIDRASMASSLEVRSPFLDYRFLEYSSRIPSKWKVNVFSSKLLMKEMISQIIPHQIIIRKKEGFNSPELQKWINKKDYKEIVEKLLKSKVISKQWGDFFINTNLENNTYSKYAARLVLLYLWFKFWGKFLNENKK